MLVTQMFPSPYLDPKDLAAFSAGHPTVVTIESIDYKTGLARQVGQASIDYFIKFREFKKFARLKKIHCDQIKQLLGSEDTDDWIGHTIAIVPARCEVNDFQGGRKLIDVINVDLVKPTTPPTLAANTDITAYGAAFNGMKPGLPSQVGAPVHPSVARAAQPPPAANTAPAGAPDMTPIGVETAAAIISELSSRNRSWDDVVKHMAGMGLAEAVAGRMPYDCPRFVLGPIRAFAKMFPRVAQAKDPAAIVASWRPPAPPPPSQPAAGEVINRSTGEVLNGAGLGEDIDDSDIPF